MAIVDANGRPIQSARLREPQTSSLVHLHREFAGHPAKGLTPARLAQILEQAEYGSLLAQHELFADMEEKDAHIQAEMHKRKMAVIGLDWTLAPPRDASRREEKAAAELEYLLCDELDIEDLLFDCLDAIGHGFACLEIEWRQAGGRWLPCLHFRPQTWFTVAPERRNELRLRDNASPYGAELQPFGWVPHVHRSRSGYLARVGLHRTLAWPYLFKNYSVRDLAEYLEIHGLPLRLGKYPLGASAEEKSALMQAVVGMGHAAAGIVPEGMLVEFVSATSAGSADPFKLMIDWCEASQSKAILGGTLTSQTGANGNRSLGDVHNEVRLDIRNSDSRQLAQTLSAHLVYPVAVLNGLMHPDRVPVWSFDVQEPEDLALYADALPKLVNIGAKIPSRYIHEKLRIPEPEADEPILQAAAPASLPSPPGRGQGEGPSLPSPSGRGTGGEGKSAAALGYAALAQPTGDPDPTPATLYTDQLARRGADTIADQIEVIRAKVETAESLEQLRDDLLGMYGDLPSGELTKVMGLAFACADLAGRFDVRDEVDG
jgi:phage gp29-like protein